MGCGATGKPKRRPRLICPKSVMPMREGRSGVPAALPPLAGAGVRSPGCTVGASGPGVALGAGRLVSCGSFSVAPPDGDAADGPEPSDSGGNWKIGAGCGGVSNEGGRNCGSCAAIRLHGSMIGLMSGFASALSSTGFSSSPFGCR